MAMNILSRIPMVAGVAYRERLQKLPASFTATLAVEPDNRYLPHAIAVLVHGEKIGYIAPEIAVNYYDAVKGSTPALTCPVRRSSPTDHDTSGVEALLDFSCLQLPTIV